MAPKAGPTSCLGWPQRWGCPQMQPGAGSTAGGCPTQLSLELLSLPLKEKRLPGGAADAGTFQPRLQLRAAPSTRHTGSPQRWSCVCSPALCREHQPRCAGPEHMGAAGAAPHMQQQSLASADAHFCPSSRGCTGPKCFSPAQRHVPVSRG